MNESRLNFFVHPALFMRRNGIDSQTEVNCIYNLYTFRNALAQCFQGFGQGFKRYVFCYNRAKKAPPARLMRNLAGRAMELIETAAPVGARLCCFRQRIAPRSGKPPAGYPTHATAAPRYCSAPSHTGSACGTRSQAAGSAGWAVRRRS